MSAPSRRVDAAGTPPPGMAATTASPTDDQAPGTVVPRGLHRVVVATVAMAAAGYLGFSIWAGWHDVSAAIARVGAIGILAVLILSLANYGLRFLRWHSYLRTLGHPIAARASLGAYIAGFALTTTPGKVGENVRSILLKRLGVPYAHSFAAFFSERLSDLSVMVLLSLIGLSARPDARPLAVAGALLVAAGLFLVAKPRLVERLLARACAGGSRLARLAAGAIGVLHQARRCHGPAVLLPALAFGLAGWSAEVLALALILHWMGFDLPLAFAAFVFAVSTLAGALSFMPGGIGGAEATMAAMLIWRGVSPADAIAATIVFRLSTLWFAVGLGTVAFASSARR